MQDQEQQLRVAGRRSKFATGLSTSVESARKKILSGCLAANWAVLIVL